MITIKQKILKYLIDNKEKTFSINGISKALKIDYKLVHTNVSKLAKEGSIKIEDFGNTKRCSFDNFFNEEVYIVEKERTKDFLKNKNFLVMYNNLKKINSQFILLMFGSQVKGTANKHSDVDLLIVANKEEAEAVDQKLDLLPYKIHLTSVSYEEFIQMLKSKEFTVVSEAMKNNIILFGIEDYYKLLSNAR
jgi:predicted nucleotidyltransferase